MTTYTNNFNFPKPAFAASNWHTDMYAFMDSVDALFETFLSVADMTGPWQNSTAYTVGQVALDTTVGGLYECLVGHTSASTGTFGDDRSANPTYWQVSSYSARALAEKWADEEEDVEVETGKYSAKHWAAKAAATVGAFGGTAILDADSDTFVKTEASADEDKVRISTLGVERVVIDASGLDATTLLEGGTALSSKYAAIAHVSDTANPHSVTKAQVGLANVTNDAQFAIANNLSEITNAAAARGHLGLSNHNLITVAADADVTLVSSKAGAEGVELRIQHDSASPANDDENVVSFSFDDDGGSESVVAELRARILDVTAGSEDGALRFNTAVAGTLANRGYIAQGMVLGAPTDGDKGAGTLNATGLYLNGTALVVGDAAWEHVSGADVDFGSAAAVSASFTVDMGSYEEYLLVWEDLRFAAGSTQGPAIRVEDGGTPETGTDYGQATFDIQTTTSQGIQSNNAKSTAWYLGIGYYQDPVNHGVTGALRLWMSPAGNPMVSMYNHYVENDTAHASGVQCIARMGWGAYQGAFGTGFDGLQLTNQYATNYNNGTVKLYRRATRVIDFI